MLSTKIIRCHILDRRDQLEDAKWWQDDAIKNLPALEAETERVIKEAREKLERHKAFMADNQKHIDYLESTMDIDWIENPPY